MSNAKGKTESRTPSLMPLALARRVSLSSANLARSFATLRPLSLLRASNLAGSLLARWNVRPTITRPWRAALAHQPWLGRVPRFTYRIRRLHELEPEVEPRATTRRTHISPGEPWQSAAEPADLFEHEGEGYLPFSAPLSQAAEEATPAALWPSLSLPGAIRPLGVPRELTRLQRLAPLARSEERISRRLVASPPRPTAARSTPVVERVPPGGTGKSQPDVWAPVSNENSPRAVEPAPEDLERSSLPGTLGRLLASATRRAEMGLAVQPEASPPAWPFRLLRPLAVAVEAREGVSFRLPLMVMRTAQHMPIAQAWATGRALAAPGRLMQMPRMQPAETMLTHVQPPVGMAVARERVVRESGPAGHAQPRPAAGTPFEKTEPMEHGGAPSPSSAEPLFAVETLASHESPVAREFPVLAWLRPTAQPSRAAQVPAQSAPAAMQVLRRFSAAQMQRALMGLAALPSLGPGEALPAAVRRPLETILQRDLSNVRTHTSPVAEAMGAEALTTGERIVFAPGRMDVRSGRSLALLAHELTHLGQPLAFKQSASTDAMDSAEQRAQMQESEVERMIEQGWPQAPRMEVRQAAQALGALARGSEGTAQRGGANLQFEQRSLDDASPALSAGPGPPSAADTLPSARLSEAPPAGSGGAQGGAPPDVDRLSREVYDILKARLRAEKIRHNVY